MSQEENIMRVYEYIRLKISQGLPPTVREIAADLGIRSTSTVHRYLAELCQRGYIEKELGHNRSIRLTDSTASVPVPIMGKVAAGVPITAVENVEGYVTFGGRYDPSELFALRVQGESMKKIGIMDGDLVIVHRSAKAENGEIIVALVEDEATVKRFYKEDGRFRLQPENDDFAPILLEQVQVLGLVVGVIRYY